MVFCKLTRPCRFRFKVGDEEHEHRKGDCFYVPEDIFERHNFLERVEEPRQLEHHEEE